MKASAIPMLSLLLLGLVAPVGWAQDKPKTEERPSGEAQTTPVKVLIVFTEYEGDKKVKSLPYTLYVNAPNASEQKPGWTRLRIGNRVPVYTGNNSFSYLDVGTNIDARGAYTGDGRFLLNLNLERSSVEGDVTVPMQKPPEANPDPHSGAFREPIVHSFKSELDLKVREGQTVESTMATDPVSGKVLKVEVSVSVVK
jgi:hypothetical protein